MSVIRRILKSISDWWLSCWHCGGTGCYADWSEHYHEWRYFPCDCKDGQEWIKRMRTPTDRGREGRR